MSERGKHFYGRNACPTSRDSRGATSFALSAQSVVRGCGFGRLNLLNGYDQECEATPSPGIFYFTTRVSYAGYTGKRFRYVRNPAGFGCNRKRVILYSEIPLM